MGRRGAGAADPETPTLKDPKTQRPAVFLDRDGVLNADSRDFIKTADELRVFPAAPEAVARLTAAGFLGVVITNQSGLARGLVTRKNLDAMNRKLVAAMRSGGGEITAIYFCPHLPGDGCSCRKPATGMIEQAAREHAIDVSRSFLVGDKPDDIACGAAAGCRTILVLCGQTAAYEPEQFAAHPDHVCANLGEAAEWILRASCESGPDR